MCTEYHSLDDSVIAREIESHHRTENDTLVSMQIHLQPHFFQLLCDSVGNVATSPVNRHFIHMSRSIYTFVWADDIEMSWTDSQFSFIQNTYKLDNFQMFALEMYPYNNYCVPAIQTIIGCKAILVRPNSKFNRYTRSTLQ